MNVFFACLSGWLHFGLILLFNALGPALWFLRRKLETVFPGDVANVEGEDVSEQTLNLLTRRKTAEGTIEITPTPPRSKSNSAEKSEGKTLLEDIEEAD